jgi:hypothetical protein
MTLALACGGCETTGNYEPPRPGAVAESTWRERVHMTDKVKTIVAVQEDEVFETRQHGLLRVQINMRNITEGEQSFRTLIEWFDVSGLKLDSPSDGWMSHIIRPKQKFTVSAMATDPDAVSWRLNVDSWSR